MGSAIWYHASQALPDGKSCRDCGHAKRCAWLLGASFRAEAVMCDWSPSRFVQAEQNARAAESEGVEKKP